MTRQYRLVSEGLLREDVDGSIGRDMYNSVKRGFGTKYGKAIGHTLGGAAAGTVIGGVLGLIADKNKMIQSLEIKARSQMFWGNKESAKNYYDQIEKLKSMTPTEYKRTRMKSTALAGTVAGGMIGAKNGFAPSVISGASKLIK